LLALEESSWEAFRKRDVKALERLTAEEFVAIPSDGERWTRDELGMALGLITIKDYRLADARVVVLNKEAAVLTYKVVYQVSEDGENFETERLYVSATWVRRGGKWVSVFYQETPRPFCLPAP
jgi:hypothetical protein